MQWLLSLLTNLTSVVGGGLVSAFGLVDAAMKKGFQSAIQFHKEGIAFARDVGLTAKQSQAYTETLIQRTEVLANKYGVSAEAIMQVQRGLSEATGKQLMLNDAQAESFVQIDKMMGAQARSKFTEEIMNGMGGQISTVEGAMAKVYATAAKQGLVAKKLTDKVAQNLGMANRLSFRNGIDGITKMAALSEKLGVNMQSIESAANKFLDLEDAITASAQMQMLGGSAAAEFGNPLTASYEANYDPEAFAERLSKSLGSYASFDAKKGISNVGGMNMDFVRNIAKALGIGVEDAVKMAKKQAEVKYKEAQFTPKLQSLGLSEDQRNFLINNSQVKNGELYYTDANGKEHNINEEGVDQELLAEMQRIANMSDRDILVEQAQKLTSIDEALTGASSSVAAGFAKGLSSYMTDIVGNIQKIGNTLTQYSEQWGTATGQVVGKAMNWINQNGPEIKNVADKILGGITKLFNLIAEYTKTAIGIFLAWKLLLKPSLKGAFGGGENSLGGRLGAKAASGTKNLLGRITNEKPVDWFRQSYQWSRNAGNPNRVGRLRALGGAFKDSWQGASKMAKGGAILGGVVGAAGVISTFSNYSSQKKDLDEQLKSGAISKQEYDSKIKEAETSRNEGVGEGVGTALGTAIGAFVGGPIGASVGGWLGGEGGKIIGRHWEGIKKIAKGVWDGILNIGKGVINGIWELLKGIGNGLLEIGKGVLDGLYDLFVKPFTDFWAMLKGVGEGIKQIFNGEGIIKGFGTIGSSLMNWIIEGLSNPFRAIADVGKGMFNAVGKVGEGMWNGVKEFARGAWDGIKKIGASVWYGFLKVLNKIPGVEIDIPKEYQADGGIVGEKHNNGGVVGALPKETLLEKHEIGGIVGGNSFSGDKILTGLNSGEMVLNKDQQAQLFKFINNASSILTKLSSSNGVSYYSTIGNNTSNAISNFTTNPTTSSNIVYYTAVNNRGTSFVSNSSNSTHSTWNGGSSSINDNSVVSRSNNVFNALTNAISSIFSKTSNATTNAPMTYDVNTIGGSNNSSVKYVTVREGNTSNAANSILSNTVNRSSNVASNSLFASYDTSNIGGDSIKQKFANIHNANNFDNNVLSSIVNAPSKIISSILGGNVISNTLSTLFSSTSSNSSTINGGNNSLSNVLSSMFLGDSTSNVTSSTKKENTLSNILSTIFNSNSNVVSTALNTNNDIKTVPFGENSFKDIPKSDIQGMNMGSTDVNVNDINLNINGTIKLDGGNSMKNIDISKLLEDSSFISSLKDLIKMSINNDINNGRYMFSTATMRGAANQVTLFGRK